MIRVDLKRREVHVDGVDAQLTRTEWLIVEALSSGHRLTSREIYHKVHGDPRPCGPQWDDYRWHILHIKKKGVPMDNKRGLGWALADTIEILE